jgi:hypothetical protein
VNVCCRCGKPRRRYARRFCSNECAGRHRTAAAIAMLQTVVCVFCGSAIQKERMIRLRRVNRTNKFCGKPCFLRWHRMNKKRALQLKRPKCAVCGKRLDADRSKPLSSIMKRKVCSMLCNGRLTAARLTIADSPKSCEICKLAFTRHPTESRPNFRRRKTCTRACAVSLITKKQQLAAESARSVTKLKQCEHCGTTIWFDRSLSLANYLKRKTCSLACSVEVRRALNKRHVELFGAKMTYEQLSELTGKRFQWVQRIVLAGDAVEEKLVIGHERLGPLCARGHMLSVVPSCPGRRYCRICKMARSKASTRRAGRAA